MATLNQIIGILSEKAGKPFDVPYQEQLKQLVSTVRLKYLKDSLEKRPQDRRLYLKSIVAEVSSVSKIVCPITYGCTLRTTLEIPQPLRSNSTVFDFVGSADFEIAYSEGGDWKEPFFKYNTYTSRKTRYKYRDNYIFLSDIEGDIRYVGIQGVFEDTSKLSPFQCTGAAGNCGFDDSEYPMPGDLIYPMIKEVIAIIMNTGDNAKKDTTEIKVDEERN